MGQKPRVFVKYRIMKLSELAQQQLVFEGGNVFKLPDGTPRTQRIDLQHIASTIDWLEQITGLDLHNNTLGSVGKKSSSGDLDLVVDSEVMSKQELAQKLASWAQKQGADPKDHVKLGPEVHFLTPIAGDPTLGFVQTDFFVDPDPKWIRFSMQSAGDASKYSGAERNLLLSSIAKAQGLKYSWKNGLVKREDDSLISKDPEEIAQKLLGPKYTSAALESVESIQRAVSQNRPLQAQLRKLIQTLKSPVAVDPKKQQPLIDPKTGEPKAKPPGEHRKTQEEAGRITQLTGVS
jgi:hypothetical protein